VAWTNRGAALCRLGRVDEALQDFTKAIALEPQNGVFRFNRGATFLDQGRYAEALEELGAAMALSPGLPNARLSAAFAHLATGSFERGWQLYQSRREVSHNARPAMDGPPLWLGDAPLDGRTILLRAEQGFGDTVQFCRYAAQIKAAGARVILRVPRSLLGLMHTLCGVDVLSSEDEPLPEADLQCLLMSLPLALGLSKPYSGGSAYLSADPHKVRAWRRRLGDAGTVRVGLVWASGKRSDPELDWVGRSRDVPFEQLRRLKGLDVQFVSLQKGEAAEKELRQACSTGWDGPAIFDVTEELVDFSDTAALIEALDLVISVDTATAHTAGALGKPVWLLNRHGGCWRWGVSGEDSAWYPTMKIYRQTRFGQWEDVLDRVRADVEALAQAGRSASPGS
jgi:tetratricopeptide (TPR) repeat protein